VNSASNRDLSIHCRVAGGEIAEVRLQGGAAPAVDRLVIAKTPQQAIELFGLMYALCGHAHQRAAVSAFERALQVRIAPAIEQLRAVAGSVEIIKEHALNLLLRLPSEDTAPPVAQRLLTSAQAIGKAIDSTALYTFPCRKVTTDTDAYEQALSQLATSLHALLGDFFSMTTPSPGDIAAWRRDEKCIAARHMQHCAQPGWAGFGKAGTLRLPSTAVEAWAIALNGPNAGTFAAAPHWYGSPCETNAYTRQAAHPLMRATAAAHGNGLYARSLARLLEIRLLYDALPRQLPFCNELPGSATAAGGAALVQVEASRGRLLHGVDVRYGLIADYRIVAPTQWNFHPQGLLPAALTGADARDEQLLQRQIEAWVATLDPCVAFTVMIEPVQ
jgi:uptake hydrogenase large subunit